MIREREKELLPGIRKNWIVRLLVERAFSRNAKMGVPALEEELKLQEKRSYTYKDLLDLFGHLRQAAFPRGSRCGSAETGRKGNTHSKDVRELTLRAAVLCKTVSTQRPRDFVLDNSRNGA